MKSKNKFGNFFYRLSVVFLIFWISFPIARHLFHIEFTHDADRKAYRLFLIFAVPLAIAFITYIKIKAFSDLQEKIREVIPVIVITGVIVFFLSIAWLFDGVCRWTMDKPLYILKSDPNVKIYYRYFGCGAWDGDPPDPKYHKVQPVLFFFRHYSEVDLDGLNEEEWERVGIW